MKYLLDTHSLIWFLEDNDKLSILAKTEIKNIQNRCFVSIASLWEIALKTGIDKLKLDVPFSRLKNEIQENNFEILPIELKHLEQLLFLNFHHRDPFDRLLIAQAQNEKMIIISKDENFVNL
jgi:PIN domain nuclease of toxin-antitoxin system